MELLLLYLLISAFVIYRLWGMPIGLFVYDRLWSCALFFVFSQVLFFRRVLWSWEAISDMCWDGSIHLLLFFLATKYVRILAWGFSWYDIDCDLISIGGCASPPNAAVWWHSFPTNWVLTNECRPTSSSSSPVQLSVEFDVYMTVTMKDDRVQGSRFEKLTVKRTWPTACCSMSLTPV